VAALVISSVPFPAEGKGGRDRYRAFASRSLMREQGYGRKGFAPAKQAPANQKLKRKILNSKGPRCRRPRKGLIVTKGNPINALPRGKPSRLVIGVMGSAAAENTIPGELKGRLKQLGQTIAKRGHVVLTGACPGMPHLTALAAKGAGGMTVGVSPARNLKEHVGRFHSPAKGLDVIQMTGYGAGMGFIAREKENIQHSDILLFTGGRSGTLGEILFAMQEPKVIALLENSTGVTAGTKSKILPHIGRGRAIFVSDQDPARLMDKAVAAHAKLKNSRRVKRWNRKVGKKGLLEQLAWKLGGRGMRIGARTSPAVREGRMQTQPVITAADKQAHNIYTFFGTTRGMGQADRAKVMSLADMIARDRTGGRTPVLVTPTRPGLPSKMLRQDPTHRRGPGGR
jgi:uncharacterized protein (TIGR00725 family)